MGWLTGLVNGIASGVGQAIGSVASKAVQWLPGPSQWRRGKIHELTNKMVNVQNKLPFDRVLYDKLCNERSKLEQQAVDSGQ